MKTPTTILETEHVGMTEDKKIQVLALINQHWDDFYTAEALAKYLEHGFIFGEFGDSEHYLVDEYMALIKEVEVEKEVK